MLGGERANDGSVRMIQRKKNVIYHDDRCCLKLLDSSRAAPDGGERHKAPPFNKTRFKTHKTRAQKYVCIKMLVLLIRFVSGIRLFAF